MADIKARLKLFEVNANGGPMGGDQKTKPEVGTKPAFGKNVSPALQKFLQKQNEAAEDAGRESVKPESVSESAATSGNISRVPKPPTALSTGNAESPATSQNESQNKSKFSPVAIRKNSSSDSQSEERRHSLTKGHTENRRVSVPKIFQNEAASSEPTPVATSNNTKPSPLTKPNIPGARPPAAAKPPVIPKKSPPSNLNSSSSSSSTPPSAAGGASNTTKTDKPNLKTPPYSKVSIPSSQSNNSAQSSTTPTSDATSPVSRGVKLPAMSIRPALKQTNSTESTASSSSSVSSFPDTHHETNGPLDLRSKLKPTKQSTRCNEVTKPATVELEPTKGQSSSSSAEGSFGSTTVEDTSETAAQKKAISPSASKPPPLPSRSAPVPPHHPDKDAASEEQKRHSSSVIIERNVDHKKFKKIKLESLPASQTSTAPNKPPLPAKPVNLSLLRQQYEEMLRKLDGESEKDEEEDIYDEGYTEHILPRRPASKRQSERISLIPEMSAEEEGQVDDDPVYDDGFTPAVAAEDGELYVDGETEKKDDDFADDGSDVYEEEGTFADVHETEEQKKIRLREEAEAKKREEKERKDREKEEEKRKRKEEKERAMKEKEEQKLAKMRKKFGLNGNEPDVGEGVIKLDSKGWPKSQSLTVKKGQMVTIVRMDGNPPNKWLVKHETGMGYVDSNNIEVDPNVIRQNTTKEKSRSLRSLFKAMTSHRKDSTISEAKSEEKIDELDQPFYDDVASEAKNSDVCEGEDAEEIYEPIE